MTFCCTFSFTCQFNDIIATIECICNTECVNIILDYRTEGKYQYTLVLKQFVFIFQPCRNFATLVNGRCLINDRHPSCIHKDPWPREFPGDIWHWSINFTDFVICAQLPISYLSPDVIYDLDIETLMHLDLEPAVVAPGFV